MHDLPPAERFAVTVVRKCPRFHLPPFVSISGDGQVVCVNGDIDQDLANQFSAVPLTRNSIVVLTSLGGSLTLGLSMAERILDAGASIVVKDYCVSACANYLFMAGREKYVLDGSYVGFHGNFDQKRADVINSDAKWITCIADFKQGCDAAHIADTRARVASQLHEILAKQDAFYARIGVDPKLTVQGPGKYQFDPDERGYVPTDPEFFAWFYTPDALGRFGVKNIVYYDYQSTFQKRTGLFEINPTCGFYAEGALCWWPKSLF